MATTIVKTIGTGGDYSTLQAWEDACPANLVSADQIWQGRCKNQEFVMGGTVLTISGVTVDATHYVELTTDAGASFRDHANAATNPLRYDATKGAGIRTTNAYGKPIYNQLSYTRISNLQVQNHSSSVNFAVFFDSLSNTMENCIIEGWNTPLSTGDVNDFVNVAVIKKSAGGNIVRASYGLNAYNCTFVVPSDVAAADYGVYGIYGGKTATLKNCAILGATTAVSLSATLSVTTCATDQAAPPTGFSTVTYANCFENSTNAATDLRLKAGSPLANSGTTDATYSVTDIIGTTRASFDVGVHELTASATSGTFTVTTADATFSGGGTVRPMASFAVTAADATFSGGANPLIGASFTLTTDGATLTGGATGSLTQGTITCPALKNNTGTVLANETGVAAYVYNMATGALVVLKSSQTTNASGVLSFTDALIVAGTTYRVVIVLSSGAEGMDKVAAT